MNIGALRRSQNCRISLPVTPLCSQPWGQIASKLQQLRHLAHHAEPVGALLEGALQDLRAPVELVGAARPAAGAASPLHLVLRHLHRPLGDAPVPRRVVGVLLVRELHDDVAVLGVPHLAERSRDDVP